MDGLPPGFGRFPLDDLSLDFNAAACVALYSFPRLLHGRDFWLRVAEKQKGQPCAGCPLMAQEKGGSRRSLANSGARKEQIMRQPVTLPVGWMPGCRFVVHRDNLFGNDHTLAEDDLRGLRRGGRCRNLRVGVIGAIQLRFALARLPVHGF